MRFYTIFCSAILFLSLSVMPAHAQLTVVQELDFGEFVSKKNDAIYSILVNTGGGYSYDPAGFIEITPPQEGIYDIGGFAPNATIMSVVVTQNSPLGNPPAEFQMVSFTETHPPTTDGAGIAQNVTIGATLQTNGNGTPYGDSAYGGKVDIVINF